MVSLSKEPPTLLWCLQTFCCCVLKPEQQAKKCLTSKGGWNNYKQNKQSPRRAKDPTHFLQERDPEEIDTLISHPEVAPPSSDLEEMLPLFGGEGGQGDGTQGNGAGTQSHGDGTVGTVEDSLPLTFYTRDTEDGDVASRSESSESRSTEESQSTDSEAECCLYLPESTRTGLTDGQRHELLLREFEAAQDELAVELALLGKMARSEIARRGAATQQESSGFSVPLRDDASGEDSVDSLVAELKMLAAGERMYEVAIWQAQGEDIGCGIM